MPRRFDSGTAANVQRTPQGGYRVDARPGRAGVLVYRNPDGSTRRELRPPEEVFAPQSLGSLAGAPVTDDHPPGAITPDNWATFAKGHVADNVGREGDFITAPLIVQDSGLCQKIDDGRAIECSCGYSCDLDPTSGVWGDGNTPYDVIQRNIVYNHVALGGKGWGRAGSGASLRLDSADAVEDTGGMKVMINGKEYESGSAEHVKALEAQVASEKARADSAARAPTAEEIRKAASARARLLVDCQEIANRKGRRFDAEAAEGADDSALMIESIKQVDPAFEAPKGGSPDFVSGFLHGYFRAIVSTLKGAPAPAMAEQDAKKEPEKPAPQPASNGPTPTQGNVPPPAAEGRADAGGQRSIFSARSDGGGNNGGGNQTANPIREAEERNRKRSEDAWKSKETKK